MQYPAVESKKFLRSVSYLRNFTNYFKSIICVRDCFGYLKVRDGALVQTLTEMPLEILCRIQLLLRLLKNDDIFSYLWRKNSITQKRSTTLVLSFKCLVSKSKTLMFLLIDDISRLQSAKILHRINIFVAQQQESGHDDFLCLWIVSP
jgi:hypothetical protein